MHTVKLIGPSRAFLKSCQDYQIEQLSKSLHYLANEDRIKISDLSQNTRKLYEGLIRGDRACLAKSITLVESTHPGKREDARKLIGLASNYSKAAGLETKTFRLGLSGPPGAGKSTFIEAMGMKLTSEGHKVAVLAVDPSSGNQGGSLLGDKTRMEELTRNPNAYIRPSPNSCHLGGVTRNTNDTILLCEVCGYDMVIVETVGVGQSEYAVVDMVDAFCLLLPPTAGDELQGIKRGIVEMSDLILVNKSDGDLLASARRTASDYTSALKFLRPRLKIWKPKVCLVSSKLGTGLDEVWKKLNEFKNVLIENDEFHKRRAYQRKTWMWSYINNRLLDIFNDHYAVKTQRESLETHVINQTLSPGEASDMLINEFLKNYKKQTSTLHS